MKARPIPDWILAKPLPGVWFEVRGPWICWRTRHRPGREGYTQLFFRRGNGKGVTVYAHRLFYEKLVAPAPLDEDLDHLCRNRPCCNPEHLEAVPEAVNLLRGFGPAARNLRKTHCVRGHEFSAENTATYGARGGRRCLACRKGERARGAIRAARAMP